MHTRREFLAGAAATAAMMLQEANAQAGGPRLLIGTSNPSASGGHGEGIFVAEFAGGKLTQPRLWIKAPSPSFLAVPAAGKPVFAVLGGDDSLSAAASYDIAAASVLGRASSGGAGGCHVGVSKDGRTVLVANYGGGSAASFAADAGGRLTEASFVQFPPDQHGPVADRQEQSHAHSTLVSPDGDFVFVNDLGLDRIHIFRLDRVTSKLMPNKPDHWAAASGSGPRHLVYHPNGRWIYCIHELNSTIAQLQWNSTHGVLTTKNVVSTLPAGTAAPQARACEMVFSKDARFLYASNRVHESFAVFSVHAATGALTLIQERLNPGREARHMAVDPSGRWFLSANQFSGDISVFPLDTATGKLGERSSSVALPGPSCLLFA